ncbi:MAG: hypothetical protein JWM58_2943 [Rhizobium sp.]|nr:hypothetical protein [Rhizobium sp.]
MPKLKARFRTRWKTYQHGLVPNGWSSLTRLGQHQTYASGMTGEGERFATPGSPPPEREPSAPVDAWLSLSILSVSASDRRGLGGRDGSVRVPAGASFVEGSTTSAFGSTEKGFERDFAAGGMISATSPSIPWIRGHSKMPRWRRKALRQAPTWHRRLGRVDTYLIHRTIAAIVTTAR